MFDSEASKSIPASKQREREEEKALIERCKNGEIGAFDELITKYEKRVFNYAYRVAGNYDDASDVAQEALIRVFHSLHTFRGDANFSTWIYRIVTNVFLDDRKKQKAHKKVSLDEYIELDENSVARQIEDDSPTPDMMIEKKEKDTIVQEAICSLPEYQRVIVALYHIEDFSYEEIAEILKLPIGTVKSRLNRARLALKEKLENSPELFGDI